MIKNENGSALITVLIFSFVVMVIISTMTYSFRMSSLTISALVNTENHDSVSDGFLRDVFTSKDISKSFVESDSQYNFDFDNQNISNEFYHKNTNVELYKAEPRLDSNQIEYQFSYENVIKSTKEIIFNNLAKVSVMQKNNTLYSLDVPFVSTLSMTDDEKLYKLSAGEILDSKSGYIGYLKKKVVTNELDISTDSSLIMVTTPSDLEDDYLIAIGWNLKAGLWTMFLAIYDDNHAYTGSTSLLNIIENTAQATLDLSIWAPIVSLPTDNIILIKWYNDNSQGEPVPLILRKIILYPPEEYGLVAGTNILDFRYILLSDAAHTLTLAGIINHSILNTGEAGANTLTIGYITDSTLQAGVAADTITVGTVTNSTINTGDGANTFVATDITNSTITTGTAADTFTISGIMDNTQFDKQGAGATTLTIGDMKGSSKAKTMDGADTVTIVSIAGTSSLDLGLKADTVTLGLVKDEYDGNVSLGSEADTLTMTLDAGASLGVNAMFDGGSGADILTLTGVTQQQWDDGVKNQFINFETITLI
jgi:hypothetical protein